MSKCKRSCCWTPYNCAKQENCSCHQESIRDVARQQRAEVIDILRGTTLARVKS